MKTARSRAHVSRYVSEDGFFCKNQLLKFRASRLTRRQYCEQNSVNYYRFTYWTKKLTSQQLEILSEQESILEKPKQLLPIKLKANYERPDDVVPFSLSFKNGCVLQIHTEQALSVILQKMV
jgi:hypothetical protein